MSAYSEVQQFYARHMQLLDNGRAEEWAATFTEDGTFHGPGEPEPLRGRAELIATMSKAYAAFQAAGEQRRHWHGMVDVVERADGGLEATCYALVFSTFKGQDPTLRRTCVCRDILVREDGQLRVKARFVTRDDMPQ